MLLYVEDDARLAKAVQRALRTYDVDTEIAPSAADALDALARREYDILLLDLVLPDSDGTALCRRIRGGGVLTPIIMYTGTAGSDPEIQAGLRAGADEYLLKPVDPETLHARIRAVLRSREVSGLTLVVGGCTLDRERLLLVYVDGTSVELMPKECQVLGYLMLHRGETVSRAALLNRYWGDGELKTRAVDNVIARLRKVLEPTGLAIQSVRNEGYMLGENAEL